MKWITEPIVGGELGLCIMLLKMATVAFSFLMVGLSTKVFESPKGCTRLIVCSS